MPQQRGPEQPTRQSAAALEPVPAEEKERLLAILNSWHKLEFFIPFDLDQRVEEAEQGRIRWLHAQALAQSPLDLWSVDLGDEYELKGFLLYVGVFDKSQITAICKQSIRSNPELTSYEELERTDLDGKTCCARLKVSPTGQFICNSQPETISLSTVPWALGQLQAGDLPALSHSHFEQAKDKLSQLLQNFHSEQQGKPLTGSGILALHQLFFEWARYSPPQGEATAVRQVLASKKKKPRKIENGASTKNEKEEEADEKIEPEISILNSFFIQDLERAAATVQSGFCPAILRRYLTPLAEEQRIEVDSEQGRWAILEALHPKHLNRGHWFSKPGQPMSLMQQFAINSAVSMADEGPLFSVNGPPGTGKTTLLKDIFAELVVRRARVLSGMRKPSDAFETGAIPVAFSDLQPVRIRRLRPELTGFEMVVASSNNAAVDNISRELPKLGLDVRAQWPEAAYLQPVAHKIAAQGDDGKFTKLPDADMPWGLLSCALGNSANRRRFKERFAFPAVQEKTHPDRSGRSKPKTIYEWIDSYRGISFADASARFKKIDGQVAAKCNRLEEYADLLRDRLESSDEANVSRAEEQLAKAREMNSRIESEIDDLAARKAKLQLSFAGLQEDERLIDRSAPEWWTRLFRTSASRFHSRRKRENAIAQLEVRQEIAAIERGAEVSLGAALRNSSDGVRQAEQALKHAKDAKAAKELEWPQLRGHFEDMNLPETPIDLETEEFQKSGLWHDEELATLRSSLLASALALHEAWLAAAAKKNNLGGAGFRSNIMAATNLLSNKRIDEQSHAAAIWQSLFLIVPVVSSTFASFARQFRDLGPASLGWLFIDEAGQAVPQAAAGAFWRARHALVVGDPRQIEPIFTLPSQFIAALAGLSPYTSGGQYSPHRTSVQRLADEANRYGAQLPDDGDDPVWIGSPLRVHRRCIEPMFSWSNRIAYNGKMIFGLPSQQLPDGPPITCESVWINIGGKALKRQEVPEQTRFVTDLLVALYQRDGRLPDLYVISPFKACKNALKSSITEADWISGQPELKKPKTTELSKWSKERVGTVHTFQGKEEDSVIMVLGADRDHAGAAEWASSKANILNVALTRAKRRFYVVGDRELWGARGCFRLSGEKLGSTAADEFLALVKSSSSQKKSAASG